MNSRVLKVFIQWILCIFGIFSFMGFVSVCFGLERINGKKERKEKKEGKCEKSSKFHKFQTV